MYVSTYDTLALPPKLSLHTKHDRVLPKLILVPYTHVAGSHIISVFTAVFVLLYAIVGSIKFEPQYI